MDAMTLADAKQTLHDNLESGTICPCCQQIAKIYTRKISSSMAYGLIALVRAYQQRKEWIHITELPITDRKVWSAVRGDFAKLRYWGLIVGKENDDDDKRSSGYWQPTQAGISFVAGKVAVPHSYGIFNGTPVSVAKNKITIHQALTDKFSYRQLVEGIPGLFAEKDQMSLI